MAGRRITVRPRTEIHPPSTNVFQEQQTTTLSAIEGIRRLENVGYVDMKVSMRQAPEIKAVINRYWGLMTKNEAGRVTTAEF
jgi:hypothetical protein